jgi:hypothetical protein
MNSASSEALLVWKPFFLLADALLFIFDENIHQSAAQDVSLFGDPKT